MGQMFQLTIGALALVLWLLVFGRVMLSWFDPTGRSPAASWLIGMTEWFLGPIRRLLPQTGMFDFSPLIVLFILGAVMRAFL